MSGEQDAVEVEISLVSESGQSGRDDLTVITGLVGWIRVVGGETPEIATGGAADSWAGWYGYGEPTFKEGSADDELTIALPMPRTS